MADPSGQIGSSLNNPMQIIGQGVQPAQQPGGAPWMKDYMQPMQGGWGPPGGGGGGGGGSGGGYAHYDTKGFGMMPSQAGPLAEALQSGNYRGWGTAYETGAGRPLGADDAWGQASASAAATRHGEEMEQQQRDQFSQQQQMGNLRMQAMQKLLQLFGGQGGMGGAGGGAGAPMPIQMDPQMLASMKASTEAAYEPVQRQLAASRARRGTGIGDSSAATEQAGMLQGRMARDIQSGYMPAMNASVAAYQPGVATRGQDMQSQSWLPQLLMRLFGGQG